MKQKLLKNRFFYLFYKVLKIYRNKKPSRHFAEFGEDIFVSRILKSIENGKYIDVGCYHPFKGSLTALLYEKKWDGINIDLSRTSIDLFNFVRKRDLNLNCAVTNFNGKTIFYENSPINQQNSLIKSNDNQKEIEINCYTLDNILEKYKIQKFDYLNIDVEGNELNVLKGLNFDKYQPSLISIENNDQEIKKYLETETYKILIKNDYIYVNKIGVTNFFMPSNLAKKISNLIKI